MPRGRPPSTGKGGGKKGRPSTSSKKEVKREEDDNDVVDLEQEEGSENEETTKEEEDNGDLLPAVPNSVKSAKKILLAPKAISEGTGWKNVEEVYVKHPRTNVRSLFLLCKKNGAEKQEDFQVYEVLTMQQETRSWFVNNRIISDGNLYVCTAVDPLFLVLPILAKSSKAMPIADLLSENSTMSSSLTDTLAKCLSHKQLENVATKKGCDDIVAFIYSEEKTLTWLSEKAEKVAAYLSKKGISLAESSVSSNFVKSSTESISKDDCLRYACDIVGEYLDDSLKKKLLEKCGLPILAEKTGVKRKGNDGTENEGSNKKTKITDGENVPLEDYGSATNTPVNKTTKVTAREKEFQKAAQGSHSLLKFFGAKPKK